MAGDTHGNIENIGLLVEYAIANDCQKILVTGDFGIFPHVEWGKKFLDDMTRIYQKSHIPIHFVKGNHDNHEYLDALQGDSLDIKQVVEGVYFHPTLCTWMWGDYKFGAVGGAYSVDRAWRVVGRDWWPNEQIRASEVNRAEIMGKVDVLVSHDCPWTGTVDDYCDFKMDGESQMNRYKLQKIVEVIQPKLCFHGHFHTRYEGYANYTVDETVVEFPCKGLAADINLFANQVYVFDCNNGLKPKKD